LIALRLRWLAAGFLLATALFWSLRSFTSLGGGVGQTLSPPGVLREIQQLNSLVSVKYVLQRAVGLEEKKVPFGSERILLFVQADVLAGVELDKLAAYQVTGGGGRFTIMLPPPAILHVVIDDTQTRVWDRAITWWTPWVPANPDLERQARLTAKEAIEKAAIEGGILAKAKENAQASIRGLLMGLGAKSVTFVPGS
jgi:hypothetical protein